MRDSGKHLKLEQQLNAIRQKGTMDVVKRLSEEQAEFVRNELKLPIAECLYEIETKRITNASSAMGLLQEIHRASKRGQRTIRKDIRKKDLKVLENAGVKFRPVKYRIKLNA